MFEGAGLAVHDYPYYDAASGGLAFDAMCDALGRLPPKSVVLLHACCHNPTGVDLSRAQVDALVPILVERGLLPYLDLAYQGFGDGIVEDAYALRALAAARDRNGRPLAFFVANSFSKSMSLYGERCGALSVACADAAEASNVLGQLKFTVRWNGSSPPIHGGQIVAAVLGEPDLRRAWEGELGAMRERIRAMRQALHGVLAAKMPDRDFSYFLHQRGMFEDMALATPGRPPPRRVRGLSRAVGTHVRRRPEPRQRRGHRAGDGRRARRLSRRVLRTSAAPCEAALREESKTGRDAREAVAFNDDRAPANACRRRSFRSSSPVEPPVR